MSRQRATRAAVWLVVVVFLVAGAASWISVRAVQGEIANRASVVQLCQAGNESRAQQITLWTHLIGMTAPPPHQTAAQHQQRAALIASFLTFVRKSFAPRDCTGRFAS